MDEIFVTRQKTIEVLLIDDSDASVGYLSSVLSRDPFIKIIGRAVNPYEAVELLRERAPDVILLDVEMPRMNGLTFLQKLMRQYPMPVIVVSSIFKREPLLVDKAKSLGAYQVLDKVDIKNYSLSENGAIPKLCEIVREAYKKGYQPAIAPSNRYSNGRAILIGASAGSPECIEQLLSVLPSNLPGIVIAIHMPAFFTQSFATRLNRTTPLIVREALDGDIVEDGTVLIAPGNRHIGLRKLGKNIMVKLTDSEYINKHRPNIDIFFESGVDILDKNSMAIILSGMGRDGVAGMMKLKNKGVLSIAQDEATSPVYGMPKVAAETGAASLVLPINKIGEKVISHFKK